MFLAKVTGSVVATQKVASMTGHKLLTVEPLRVDPAQRDRLVGTGRTFVVRRYRRRRAGRDGADRARLECPPDAGDGEAAGRRDHHRHRGHGQRRKQDDFLARTASLRQAARLTTVGLRMKPYASHRRSDSQRGAGSAVGTCATATADRRRNGKAAASWGVFDNVDDAVDRRGQGAARIRAARPGRAPQGRRLHSQDLHRAGRGTGPRGIRGNQDRPARPQDRKAEGRRATNSRRRVPARPRRSAARTASRFRNTPRSASSASSRR